MKIAYLITAYLDPKALANLVKALKTNYTDFYIHIDKKVNIYPFIQAIKEIKDLDRIVFLNSSERINVRWGGYTQVLTEYNLLKKMINSNVVYDWVINLTGLDYPVWSNAKIQDFLQKQKAPVIKGYDLLDLPVETQNRKIKKYWFFDLYPTILRRVVNKCAITIQDMFHIERDYLSLGYRFCFGGEYWAIPFEIAKAVTEYYESDKQLQKNFSYCVCTK